jgi:hypothetical protein
MDELLIPAFVLISLAVPLLALALLLYAIPVRVVARLVRREGHRDEELVLSWGLVGVRTSRTRTGVVTDVLVANRRVFSRTGSRVHGEKEQVPVHPPRGTETPGTVDMVQGVQALLGPAVAFGSAFWRECRFEEVRGRVTLGLGDPVLTGECCGLYWASRCILEASRIYLELVPVFDRQVLELDITARMHVRHPLLVLIAGLRLARHPAIRGAMQGRKPQSRGVPAS